MGSKTNSDSDLNTTHPRQSGLWNVDALTDLGERTRRTVGQSGTGETSNNDGTRINRISRVRALRDRTMALKMKSGHSGDH